MKIAGMVPCSTVDYPHKLSAVLFTPGCNYDCGFCHNRHLLQPNVECMSNESVWLFLNKRRGLLDAVVISGGEPTLQKDLAPFIRDVRALGYLVKLDTNGSQPDVLHNLLRDNLLDYVAIDYKAPWEQYDQVCGCHIQCDAVQRSMQILHHASVGWEMRTTMLPSLSLADYDSMAQQVQAPPRYVCNAYRDPAVRWDDEYTAQPRSTYNAAVHQILKQYWPHTEVII